MVLPITYVSLDSPGRYSYCVTQERTSLVLYLNCTGLKVPIPIETPIFLRYKWFLDDRRLGLSYRPEVECTTLGN